jgi:hypothetical protein
MTAGGTIREISTAARVLPILNSYQFRSLSQ